MFGSNLNIGSRQFKTPDSGQRLPDDGASSYRWSAMNSGQIPHIIPGDLNYSFEFPVANNNPFVEISQVRIAGTFYDNTNGSRIDVTNTITYSLIFPQNCNTGVLFFGNQNGQPINVILNRLTNGTVAINAICLGGSLSFYAINPSAGSYLTIDFAILYR